MAALSKIIGEQYLLFLFGLIGSLILFILQNQIAKRIRNKKAFKAFESHWISSKKLQYSDSMTRKEYPEKHPSTQKDLPGKVLQSLKNNKDILLMSEPMAGKTYFSINFLRGLKKTYVLRPDNFNFNYLYDDIPKAPRKANYRIIFFDDIQSYINTSKENFTLNSFIHKARKKGYIIWANTLIGGGFEVVRDAIEDKKFEGFDKIIIPGNLSREEALSIARSEGLSELPEYFDGNIGSIFCDVIQKKNAYNDLDPISKLILRVVKELYMVGLYSPPQQVLKEDFNKLFNHYEPNITRESLISGIANLEKRNFLFTDKSLRFLIFDEVLLRLVVEHELSIRDFITSISAVFPRNAATYNQAIHSSSNYNEAEFVYNEMCNLNIQPNEKTFINLIRKSKNSDIGLSLIPKMKEYNIRINENIIRALLFSTKGDAEKKVRLLSELNEINDETKAVVFNVINSSKVTNDLYDYTTLMNLSGNYDKALDIFSIMESKDLITDSVPYNILIKFSNDLNKGLKILDEIKNAGFLPDSFNYGTLMNLCDSYNDARRVFDMMISDNVIPNEANYGILMKLSDDFNLNKELLKEMKSKVHVSPSRYGFVINQAPNFQEAQKLFNEMIREEIIPTCAEFGTLINKAPDYKSAREVFDLMISKNKIPTNIECGTLLSKLTEFSTSSSKPVDYEIALEFFNEMISMDLEPNEVIYGNLINLSPDFETGLGHFKDLINKNLPPSVNNYGSLINLSKDFKIAEKLFNEMKNKWNITPNVEIYGTMIKVAPNYQYGRCYFDELIRSMNPNLVIYNTLIKKSGNYNIGLKIVEEMRKKYDLKPNLSTYNALISVCKDFQTAKKILFDFIDKGEKPDTGMLCGVMKLIRQFQTGIKLIDALDEKEIKLEVELFGLLMDRASYPEEIKDVLKRMKEAEVEPNEFIYTRVIKKCRDKILARKCVDEMNSKGKSSASVYNAFLSITNDYTEAISIVGEMQERGASPDVVTYNILMAKSNKIDLALTLYNEMRNLGIYPSDKTMKVLVNLAGNHPDNLQKLNEATRAVVSSV